jgi:hypothetical protein
MITRIPEGPGVRACEASRRSVATVNAHEQITRKHVELNTALDDAAAMRLPKAQVAPNLRQM